MTISPENDLLSVAKMCELLKASPREIELAAETAGVSVALRLNLVSYFSDRDLDAIRYALEGNP
jgi:hypothetical protein